MPLSADDRLILIRVKIRRAKKHLLDLESEVIAFRDKKLYGLFPDTNLTTEKLQTPIGQNDPRILRVEAKDFTAGEFSSPVFNLRAFRILTFSAVSIAGDVVQNLRSALDYLASQLVWAGSGEPPSRRVEFPVAKDAITYERDKPSKVAGICPKAIKAIDAFKPYKGGNNLLWKIHELNNIDKHRSLFTVDTDCVMLDDWLPPFGYLLKAGDPTFFGVFDDEVEKSVEFEFEKAITQPQIPQGDALLPTLHQMVNFVEDLVESFRPFLG